MQHFVYLIAFRTQVKACRGSKAEKAIAGLCIESGNRSISQKAVLNLHYQALAKFMKPNYSELDTLCITLFPLILTVTSYTYHYS